MHHIGTCRLETQRLTLRRFAIADAQAMYRNWASDDEVTKYLTWPTHPDAQESEAVLTDWVQAYVRDDWYQWAIVLREQGDEPIGSIGVVSLNDDIDMVHIGYCIGRPWWHQGIMSEALQALIGFFFDRVGAQRVESKHDPNNPNSGLVMRKCGMRYEGTMRRADRNNQGICDCACYAILSSDR